MNVVVIIKFKEKMRKKIGSGEDVQRYSSFDYLNNIHYIEYTLHKKYIKNK